jgi:MoxR-like ATPase
VPRPFIVMATQNPIESDGTYVLPEAQVDRFLMKVLVGYPSREEEAVIVERAIADPVAVRAVAGLDALLALQRQRRAVYVDPALVQFAVTLVGATRDPGSQGLPELARFISHGASPRASIALIEVAQALALLRGRSYVLPDDVVALAADVLRHRLVLSYEALAETQDADTLIARLLERVPAPAALTRDPR